MRLAQYLEEIRKQRDQEAVQKLQSLQPYMTAMIDTYDRDLETQKNRDNLISDQSHLLANEGYVQTDIDQFKVDAGKLKGQQSIIASVDQFKERKRLVSELQSIGVSPGDTTNIDELRSLHQSSIAAHRDKTDIAKSNLRDDIDIAKKAKLIGRGDEFNTLVAERGMDPMTAYGELTKTVSRHEIDIEAKRLGSSYYKQYNDLVNKGADPVTALADVTDRKSINEQARQAKDKEATTKTSTSTSPHIKNVINDGSNSYLYYKKGGVVYRIKVMQDADGNLKGINPANGGALSLNPNIKFMTPNERIKIDDLDIEDTPGVTYDTKTGALKNADWVDVSKLRRNTNANTNTSQTKDSPEKKKNDPTALDNLLKKYVQ